MCAEKIDVGKVLVKSEVPKTDVVGFQQAINEVRQKSRPLTLDMADAVSESLGGAVALGKMLSEDLKKIRGDHLPPEMRDLYDVDVKALKGMYELVTRLFSARDELVGENSDPLDGVSPEDLMAIASEAAFARIAVDAEFRRRLLKEMVPLDPEAVIEAAGDAFAALDGQPKVEVLNG